MNVFRDRSWRWISVAITAATMAVAVVWCLVVLFSPDARAQRERAAAAQMAEQLGLQLTDIDQVVFGEVYSSFPDSSAYLVVEVVSDARADTLVRESGLTECRPAKVDDRHRLPEGQGPTHTPTSRYCATPHSPGGLLVAVWDPATDSAPRLYIRAIHM